MYNDMCIISAEFFIIHVETGYLKMKKVVLALVNASRKLKPYFQTHQVTGWDKFFTNYNYLGI
jgi:hypothetical protein